MGLKNSLSDLFKLGEIKDSVIKLIEAKFELKKLEIQEKIERAVADAIFRFVFLVLGSIAVVFLLMIAAWGLNLWLGAPWGYVLIFALLAITLGVIYLKRTDIKLTIREVIQKEMDAMDS
ncbi:phage holin family protein [Jiulongibacter sp. NS-SX5]|uniref:phage holin family protein n=1 Tax=Jiulongibacter sp. NS-SX5 TaxID=3463854 RepID=UPI004059EE48